MPAGLRQVVERRVQAKARAGRRAVPGRHSSTEEPVQMMPKRAAAALAATWEEAKMSPRAVVAALAARWERAKILPRAVAAALATT